MEDVKEGCVGVFHCGEKLIELLSRPVLQERWDPDGAIGRLATDAYLTSIVAHELAHAATDDVPCPSDDCPVTAEYIAYVMQVMSLSDHNQVLFENSAGLKGRISSQELAPILPSETIHVDISVNSPVVKYCWITRSSGGSKARYHVSGIESADLNRA